MNYVVAVSGGVDSIVLLDKLVKDGRHTLIVAHFDHGIRNNSFEDARFVERVARKYTLPFETVREELGSQTSEEVARTRRYAFLRMVAKKYKAIIVTAHHLDDLVETVAINFIRGTGWRGLAVFDAQRSGVERPLIGTEKKELLRYAHEHSLEWREDATNASDRYLRNRLRPQVQALTHDQKYQILALNSAQKELRHSIEAEVRNKIDITAKEQSRYVFIMLPQTVALEYLRTLTKGLLTLPQRKRLLGAIKVAQPGTIFEAGSGINVGFTTRHFSL